jgi:DNA-binding beta-propeller fold protein YncE
MSRPPLPTLMPEAPPPLWDRRRRGLLLAVAGILALSACAAREAPLPHGAPGVGGEAASAVIHIQGMPAHGVSGPPPSESISSGWRLDEVVYRGEFLHLFPETDNTRSVDFHPDGTLLFVVGRDTENVVTYQLSTPWDVTTGQAIDALDLSGELGSRDYPESVAHGFYIRKEDGSMLWVWNRTEIFEYTLDEPWRVSSARPTGHQGFTGTVLRGHDIDFRPDGLRLYVDDRDSRAVFQFALTEAWDVTSATLEYRLDISDQEEAVRGIEFKPDGTRMFLMDTARRDILEYHLAIPWEIEAARFVQALPVGGQHDNPRGITWRTDGTRFYVTQASGRPALHQYDLVEQSGSGEWWGGKGPGVPARAGWATMLHTSHPALLPLLP